MMLTTGRERQLNLNQYNCILKVSATSPSSERKIIPEQWRPVIPRGVWASSHDPVGDVLRKNKLKDHPWFIKRGRETVGYLTAPYKGRASEQDIEAARAELERRWDVVLLVSPHPIYDPHAWDIAVLQPHVAGLWNWGSP
jgi:hypothetical protein